jgi:hypothetical protein
MVDKSGSGWPVGHIGIPVIGPNSPNDKLESGKARLVVFILISIR